MLNILYLILHSFWDVLGQMAPYLIFGYLIAGVLSVFVTAGFVEKHLGDNSFTAIFKAALLGMPLPLCSCSVIPVTASLRKHGAGRGAVASFLISTPTTGVDSIMAAWALLGPVFAIYRAVISVVLGIVTGLSVSIFAHDENENSNDDAAAKGGACCSAHSSPAEGKFRQIFRYAFLTLPKDLGKPLFIGIFIASVISAFIEAGVIEQFLDSGFGTMLLMLVVGIPLYVCATSSIPFAIGFMALGASPGAALVFLIAGPATNGATITVLWKLIGKRSTLIMLGCIVVGALGSGLLLDYLWPESIIRHTMAEHGHGSYWFYSLAAIVLLFVQFWSVYSSRILSLCTGRKVAPVACCDSDHGKDEAVSQNDSCCSCSGETGCGDSQEKDTSASSCCSHKRE